MGEFGQIDVRLSSSREDQREYLPGAYWSSGVFSQHMIPANAKRVELANPLILVTDLTINDPHQLEAVFEAARAAGSKSLLILAKAMSDKVLGVLLHNSSTEGIPVVAAHVPGSTLDRAGTLNDIIALVGGRPLLTITGDTLAHVRQEDFGTAQRVWVNREHLGIVDGKGDTAMLDRHVWNLQENLRHTHDPEQRAAIEKRLGKFTGVSATLRVGGISEPEMKQRQASAKRTANVLRSVLRAGVLPGAGTALRTCQPVLKERLAQSTCTDEHSAYSILYQALSVPMHTIIANAGYDPGSVLARIPGTGAGYWGFDVQSGKIVDVMDSGIWDAAVAYRAALRNAVSGAAQALTIDVLIHRKNPERVLNPG